MKDMVVNKRVSWGSERVELEKDMQDERSGESDAHFYVCFLFYKKKEVVSNGLRIFCQ